MRYRQRGMTFIGLIILMALVGVVGYGGLRLVPVYLNYMKIARAMEQVASETKGENPDPGRIRVALDKHWIIEDINQVASKDIEVSKDGDGVLLHVAYDQSVPYLANVSLTATFDKSVKID